MRSTRCGSAGQHDAITCSLSCTQAGRTRAGSSLCPMQLGPPRCAADIAPCHATHGEHAFAASRPCDSATVSRDSSSSTTAGQASRSMSRTSSPWWCRVRVLRWRHRPSPADHIRHDDERGTAMGSSRYEKARPMRGYEDAEARGPYVIGDLVRDYPRNQHPGRGRPGRARPTRRGGRAAQRATRAATAW
jgi:hypothetical protein